MIMSTESSCQEPSEPTNSTAMEQNEDSFPIDSLRFPVDRTMQIVFTGFYTGFSVEVRSPDEVALLYHMGCFGKGSFSRSKPKVSQSNDNPNIIMRKRQFLQRNCWYKKFGGTKEHSEESDAFFKELDELAGKINSDSQKAVEKDVIDLVSSDEELSMEQEELEDCNGSPHMDSPSLDKENVVVIVPNSDSEEDNYFANLKPKCCVNKIRLNEKLMLTLQEAFFLMYGLGCLQVVDRNNRLLNIQKCWDLFTETDKNFTTKYVVYHYFRAKGYVVKPGIKFGGDYLLYREGPGVQHADYIVVIKYEGANYNWFSVLGHVRMSVTTVKEILMVEVIKPTGEYQKLPENLSSYSVRETLLNRKIPVTINDEE